MGKSEVTGTHLWLVLWKAFRAMESYDLASIAGLGFCLSDFAVLEILLHKGPLPVNTIGRRILLTTGSITTAVDRLEAKKLVRRTPDTGDRRVVRVALTVAGRKLIRREFARHAERLEIPARALNPEERAVLLHLLRRLGQTAETLMEQSSVTKK
jgi:MarR family 2-MHQ and catechol resistance regulon transcriptional repressor